MFFDESSSQFTAQVARKVTQYKYDRNDYFTLISIHSYMENTGRQKKCLV